MRFSLLKKYLKNIKEIFATWLFHMKHNIEESLVLINIIYLPVSCFLLPVAVSE